MVSRKMGPERAEEASSDLLRCRADFPVLEQRIYGKPLVYLDNAATTQKPKSVIERVRKFYAEENSNIHRGVFCLSEKATLAYEAARSRVHRFLGSASPEEIVFVRGATEAINLVAQSYGRTFVKTGDEIVISAMEHHANIVPWQMLCEAVGAKLRVIPMNERGELLTGALDEMLGPRVKILAVTQVSNALGTINDVKPMIALAHERGIPVLVDGAQAVAHMKVDVRELDCDFYVFSGHKTYGPTGTGVLYGKREWLEKMPPYQGGGDMIESVTFEKTIYNVPPYKFEAGTPNIAGVIGLGAALEYLEAVGVERAGAYEKTLLETAVREVEGIESLRIIGTAKHKAAILSFVLGDAHAHDIGTILDREGIAVRVGHHCAMPVMKHFGIAATARASFALYNNRDDVLAFAAALKKVVRIFR
ncbi:MAG: SufS family cysteine desulfurase [Candidatus Omnitrophota bacterium]